MKKSDICRAMTFISYNIPIAEEFGTDQDPDYSTIGFFDGLFTKVIDLDYSKEFFKKLWEHSIELSIRSAGKYSYQNIFCFSKNEWNDFEDDYFWSYEVDDKYPLTFVVFFQLSDYCVNELFEGKLCKFKEKLKIELRNKGVYYSYITMDKNDLVVCIKSEDYRSTLNTIKLLHDIDQNVIYSYTTLSINNEVLKKFNGEKYPLLYSQIVDSISLKGVTNSYNLSKEITLEKKYRELASELKSALCLDESNENVEIFDILGDDDFRFVAQNVNLGCLLEQYGPLGKLSYHLNADSHLRFYLYSSSMRLNVRNTFLEEESKIDLCEIKKAEEEMNAAFIPKTCELLEKEIEEIKSYIQSDKENYLKDEKIVTFCQALWQILQSIKALERAPTKHYDFYTLYIPFSLFVRILNEKIKEDFELGEKEEIYTFIRKISMTIQGTLKNDIQFFQVNDYNAIAHYAPTKLRAFYSAWALKLSNFYNLLSEEEGRGTYSFIFTPGVFKGTEVRQLFSESNERARLMLITIPERHIYVPKWLLNILGHEVGHFVGHTLRNRELRRDAWMRVTARLLTIEWSRCVYINSSDEWKKYIVNYVSEEDKFQKCISEQIFREMQSIDEQNNGVELHSKEALGDIKQCVDRVLGIYGNDIQKNYFSYIESHLENLVHKESNVNLETLKKIKNYFYKNKEEWAYFMIRFRETTILDSALNQIKYVMSEMFSDMMSILTFDLMPKDYILAFKNSEYSNNLEVDQMQSASVNVRIGIVINVIKQLVTEKKEFFLKEKEFKKGWTSCTLENLAQEFENESLEQALVLFACEYCRNICNYKFDISSYVSIYEQEMLSEKKIITYITDEQIYDEIYQYLLKCGRDYIQKVCSEKNLVDMRKTLREYYKLLENGTPCEIVQAIEKFLYEFEQENVDNK